MITEMVLNGCASCHAHTATIARGHKITDVTGSVDLLRAEFPDVSVFGSGEGVLYATHAWPHLPRLCRQLRAE